MRQAIYRRLPVALHWTVCLCCGCVGLQYVVPSRLYSIKGRIVSLFLVGLLWWALFFFHERNAVVLRECALVGLIAHYCFGIFYAVCFAHESTTLLSSDIKDKKLAILKSWQRDTSWKRQSILQV